MILCYLDGRTTEDAAQILGIPRGTVLSRLATARQRLSARLTRRGVTLPVAGLAWGSQQLANPQRVEACVAAAMRYANGTSEPTAALQLANGVLAMQTRKLAILWGTTLLLASGLATGVGVSTSGPGPRVVAAPVQAPPAAAKPTDPVTPPPPPADKKAEQDREKRLYGLDMARAHVEERIAKVGNEIRARESELQNPIILKALGDVYSQAEISAFQMDLDRRSAEANLAALKERLREMLAIPVDREDLEAEVERHGKVRNHTITVSNLERQLVDLKTRVGPDNPAVLAAEEKFAKANAELKAARETARPIAEREIRDMRTRKVRGELQAVESDVVAKTRQKADLDLRRAELRKQIEAAGRTSVEIESLKAELQTLRDQSRQLSQARFETEFQLGKRSATDDALERILKELTELRAEVRALKDAKK